MITSAFRVYVQHPTMSFGNPVPEFHSDDIESCFDYAFSRVAEIVPNCTVWIETETGKTLPIMN